MKSNLCAVMMIDYCLDQTWLATSKKVYKKNQLSGNFICTLMLIRKKKRTGGRMCGQI